jgi:hypothetical protein
MVQKFESNKRPEGRAGVMAQESMGPPRFVGRMSGVVEPLVRVIEAGL